MDEGQIILPMDINLRKCIMKSIRNEQFNQPLAENQEEYNTLYINLNPNDQMCPATVCFELSFEDIEQITKTGKLYYQQCLFTQEIEIGGQMRKVPAHQFHPMNISVNNPLEPVQENIELPLIRLTEMSGDHFEEIFHCVGFALAFKKEIIAKFNSLHGFHLAISNYGAFDSHRKAVELGYDVEFTLSQ